MWAQQNRLRAARGEPPLPPPKTARKVTPPPESYPRPAPPVEKAAQHRQSPPKRTIELSTIVANTIVEASPLLWQNIIAGEKWLGIPIDVLDKELRKLAPTDQVVLIRLYRLTWGYKKDTCEVGYETLAKACRISRKQAQISTARLEAAKYIKRLQGKLGGASRYKMLLPPAIARASTVARNTIVESATIKENIKDKELIDASPEEIAEYERATGRRWEG